MNKRKAQPRMETRHELALQPVVNRTCAHCHFFEPGTPGWCYRYPQLVAKKPEMRACGEFSER